MMLVAFLSGERATTTWGLPFMTSASAKLFRFLCPPSCHVQNHATSLLIWVTALDSSGDVIYGILPTL